MMYGMTPFTRSAFNLFNVLDDFDKGLLQRQYARKYVQNGYQGRRRQIRYGIRASRLRKRGHQA